VVANVDQLRLGQVLTNLIDNAIKFSPEGGLVRVRVEPIQNGSRVRLSVQDEGPGIPPEQREQVFERLFQTSDHPSGGLGLGLYICRQIVALHGGEIHIEAPGPTGTTFVVTLAALPKGFAGASNGTV
jgi:signal transduction histidine kinase